MSGVSFIVGWSILPSIVFLLVCGNDALVSASTLKRLTSLAKERHTLLMQMREWIGLGAGVMSRRWLSIACSGEL